MTLGPSDTPKASCLTYADAPAFGDEYRMFRIISGYNILRREPSEYITGFPSESAR
jgi:hypothetical protein